MSKITIDELARMMQDEFSKVHEKFNSIDERFALTDEKIDNLAIDTKRHFSVADEKIDNLIEIVEWMATELKTLKQELVFNQVAHDRYESRIVALEKQVSLVQEKMKK